MREELVATFIREAEAVGAGVCRSTKTDLIDTLERLLQNDQSIVAATGLEEPARELRARGLSICSEAGGTGDEVESNAAGMLPQADAGLVAALAGIATSGTVLLGPGAGLEGHIAILPPHCVVVLPNKVIEPDLAAALANAASLVAAPGSRLAFVTGPSRTSDIELTTVLGVHGPLRLDVVIVDG